MKRFLIIISVLSFLFVSIFVVKKTQNELVSTENTTSGYAKVITNDCYLFKDSNNKDKYFLLEQSYFVKVIEDVDNLFYKVEYIDFFGYVPKSKIQFVEEYPKNPYLSGITFDIYDLGNVCLRSTPESLENDKNVICTIPNSTKDLLFYGKISGEEAIKELGNLWYYCSYQDKNGKLYYGYVYSPLTRNLSSITNSSENLTVVNVTSFLPVESLLYLNLSTKNMLIVITTIPSIFVIALLTIPKKNKKSE